MYPNFISTIAQHPTSKNQQQLMRRHLLMHCLFYAEALEFLSWKVSEDIHWPC
jgi:uncharacterized protein YaeQ